jgi:2-oxoglutarate dehydrogenase E1 component
VIKKIKKPLIVMTPKSLLRAPICTSELSEFENGSFQEILDDPNGKIGCKKLIFCSGKIYYDLIQERKNANVTIIRIEQLYPLNKKQLDQILSKYTGYLECVWVQEEPENMGAWTYIKAFLPNVKYIGRSPCATTATGSNRKHKQEQKALIEKALS